MNPEELPRRVRYRFTFLVEQLLVRGLHYRLLLIVAIIGLLSVVGGWLVTPDDADTEALGEATWWAFLRLTDPGYLGDDEGALRRTVSTILTILGYVVFLGALVATMTQWLNATVERLQLGLTPVRMRGHVVILGWTDRTSELIREILLAAGSHRRSLLRRLGLRRYKGVRLAVLADRVGPALVQELRDELGPAFSSSQIVLRSGSSLRSEHLDRVDVLHAAAVLLPGADAGPSGVASQDARTMKVLLTLSAMVRENDAPPPAFVGELYDQRSVPSARDAYPGRVELVATEGLVGRMLAGSIIQPGLAAVHQDLLTHHGSSLFVQDEHELGGVVWIDAIRAFSRPAVLLGRVRQVEGRDVVELNPAHDAVLEPTDRLVVLARDEFDSRPLPHAQPRAALTRAPVDLTPPSFERLLVLGWNRKAPSMLAELERHLPNLAVTVASPLPEERRIQDIAADGVLLSDLAVEHCTADYTNPATLRQLVPERFDRILLLSSETVTRSEEADARSIATYLLLAELLLGRDVHPEVLVELNDPDDASLLRRYPVHVLSSPRLVSHVLAQVALRNELHLVMHDLLGGGGPDVRLAPAQVYGLQGRLSFDAIEHRVRAAEHTALGVRRSGSGGVHLNPPLSTVFELGPDDEIVVVA